MVDWLGGFPAMSISLDVDDESDDDEASVVDDR